MCHNVTMGTNRSRFLVVLTLIMVFCASTPVSAIRRWRVTLCMFVCLCLPLFYDCLLSCIYARRVL